MDWNRIEGNWKEYRGKVRERWGKLTDDDLDVIKGKRDQLIGKLQQAYGIAREKAEEQVTEFEKQFGSGNPDDPAEQSASTKM